MQSPWPGSLSRRAKFPRTLATGAAIGGVYLLLLGLVYLLGRLALQEMDHLASGLPGMVEGLDQAAGRVQGWLYHLAQDAPERLQPGLEESITQLFSNGSALAEGAVSRVLGAASQIIVTLPDTFVFLGHGGCIQLYDFGAAATAAALSPGEAAASLVPADPAGAAEPAGQPGWMVSGTVQAHGPHVPAADHRISHPTGGVSSAFGGHSSPWWTLCLCWGTGTILVPWGLLVLLQGQTALGLGLIALYGVTALTRSILEPRMVGHQLGLNPLLTLVALYMGYRLWGILGMILAPVLTITVLEIWSMAQPERGN